MPTKGGIVTRKDMFSDDAMQFGPDYAKNLQIALDKNEELVKSVIELNKQVQNFKGATSQKDYITTKEAEALTTQKATNAIKLQEAAELSANKIKQSILATNKSALDLEAKKAKVAREMNALLIEEEKLNQQKAKSQKEELAAEQQLQKIEIEKERLKKEGINSSKEAINVLIQQEKLTKERLSNLKSENALVAAKEREIAIAKQGSVVWKEQISSENQLISLKRKNELATEGTNKAVIKERISLAETTKELKLQARERLGLVGTYEKLNRARSDSQKRLADLLSAEKKNTAEIIVAQREFDILDKRVKIVDETINNYSKHIGDYQSAFSSLGGTFRDLIATFGLVAGLELFGVVVKDIFSVILDFDRQLIAVGKTTNIAGEDLKQFGREVVELGDKLNGVTVAGLIQSAEVAGQLGVTGTDNILKFASSIEKLKLTSDIISDEEVGQFAKFIEVSSDSFENADKLASVITQLGNSFATTEKEVLANATEIQKGVAVYSTSAQGVLALGAATSSLGSEAEVSASSIQKTFGVINKAIATGKNLENVLKLTNLTQKELSKQFNQDATGVFVKFIKGLNTAKKEGQNLAVVLGELGLDEVRSFKTIGSLAANYDLLASAMEQAKKEYIDNIALNKEVEAASESLSSILGDINDRYEAYILTTNDANSGSLYLAKGLKLVRDNFKEIIDFVVKFGTIILVYIGVIRTVSFVTSTWGAIQAAATAGQIRFALSTGIGTRSILAQAAAARQATVAQEGLNLATKATPWGLILAFLSAAVVAYMIFNDEMSDAEKNIQKIVEANKEMEKTEKFYSDERDKANDKHFKAIEADIKLRKAKGENSDKLDKEEIERKKAIIQSTINTVAFLENIENKRTQADINFSNQRIAQFQIEKNALEKSGYRVSAQGNTSDELNKLIKTEKEKKSIKQAVLTQNSKIATDELTRLNAQLQDLDKDAAVKDAEFKTEETKKAKAERLKLLKEKYEAEKKAQDDLFKLQQFRIQVAIDINDEILNNDKATYDKKLDALSDNIQLESEKKRNSAEYELTQLGKYNEKTGKFIREMTDLEIKMLLESGIKKEKMTAGQLAIFEKFQDDQKKITQKGNKDRQKIIDSEVEEVKKRMDAEVLNQETKLNKALEAENILFNASLNKNSNLEKAQEEHERRIVDIKRAYAKEGLSIQIHAIEALLKTQEKIPENEKISAEKRAQIDNELARLKKDNSDLDVENNDAATKKKLIFEEDNFKAIEKLALELKDALQDLGNAIFDARIQNIEAELTANDNYYAKQIELAGKDERQKELLQKERDKKNDALEKKKRKEQEKQAVFNKALAVAEAGYNTAKAVTAALTAGPGIGLALAVITAAVAAVQLAAIVATPIPKYKMGRKNGPEEWAYVGDGGVSEVIERKSGAVEITPATDTLVRLKAGDKVHSSVEEYQRLQRASVVASINMEGRKTNAFQASQNFESAYTKEMLLELKETRKAIQKQKTNITINNKVDISHSIWKGKNTNWE